MSTLKEEAAKRLPPREERSILTSTRPGEAAFIEFYLSPHDCCAYAPGQILHYQLLTQKPDVASDPTRPPQTLTLGFPSVDLIITGSRLELITAALKQGTLETVRVIPQRFAELHPQYPFVASIKIKRVDEGQEETQ